MIYNFLNDLQNQFPSYIFVIEGMQQQTPQQHILIRESSGASRGYPDNRIDALVQVMVKDSSQFQARTKAHAIFDYNRERFNITLSGHPDDPGGAPLFVRRIFAVQAPYSTGRNADGLSIYVNNYGLTYSSPVV